MKQIGQRSDKQLSPKCMASSWSLPEIDPTAQRERSTLMIYANAVGLVMLAYLLLRSAIQNIVVRIFMLFMPSVRYYNLHLVAPEWVIQLVSGICFLLSGLIPYLMYMAFIRMPTRVALPLKKPQLSFVVPAVLISLAVSVIASAATGAVGNVLRIIGLLPVMPAIAIPTDMDQLVAGLLNLCILPAIVEECIYRGVLLQSLRRFGDGFALAVSAVIFSVLHLNLTQAPVALLMGLVMGYFVLRTGSLWTGIVIHFVNNLLALTQQMVIANLSVRAAETVNTIVLLVYLLLGILATVLLSRSTDDLFHLKTQQSAFTMRMKSRIFFTSPAIVIVMIMILTLSLQNIQRLPR